MHELPRFPFLSRIFRRIWLQAIVLAVLMSGHVLLEFVPEAAKHPTYPKIISFLSVWIVAWIVSRTVTVFRDAPFVTAKLAPNLRPLVFTLINVVIYLLGFLVALDSIGVSITPLLASLGVGSLAVGLALQDTLGNLFSGFYLYVDRPIAIGDWIRLENGIEGQVVAIGWRSTHLLMPQENMVVIPNSKLSGSMVTNFSLPIQGTGFTIPLGVGYESDLEETEKVLIQAVGRVVARMPSFFDEGGQPTVRFTKFGESSIDLTLGVRSRSFPDQAIIRHEVIKEVKASLAQAKIDIPYPQRVVRQFEPSNSAH